MNRSVPLTNLSEITDYLIRLAYAPAMSDRALTDEHKNLALQRTGLLKIAHRVETLKATWSSDRREEVELCCSLLDEIVTASMSDDAIRRMHNSVRQMRPRCSAISSQYHRYSDHAAVTLY